MVLHPTRGLLRLLCLRLTIVALCLVFSPSATFGKEIDDIALSFDEGWKFIQHGDNKRTEFIPRGNVLRLQAAQSVGFYTHRLPRLSQISHCNWWLDFSWRVLSAAGWSSQKTKGLDDRPLALHLWVNDASQFGWFKGNLAKLFSIPTPGYMLTYSWGADDEWQQSFPNPHLPEKGRIVVLRKASEVGASWYRESINLTKGLAALAEIDLMKKPLYLAVSADTEDSGGSAIAETKDLLLRHEICDE